ncbi:hypothetical protein ACFX10_021044 [Malus domestica]
MTECRISHAVPVVVVLRALISAALHTNFLSEQTRPNRSRLNTVKLNTANKSRRVKRKVKIRDNLTSIACKFFSII